MLTDSAEMQFNAGQSIFQAGSPANRFHLILEGKVVLESDAASRGIIAIETLGPGDGLGWSWLFPPFYLKMNARALEPTRTIFFYGTRLQEQGEQDHELGYQLMKRIAEVAIKCLGATQQRLMECADIQQSLHFVIAPVQPTGPILNDSFIRLGAGPLNPKHNGLYKFLWQTVRNGHNDLAILQP